MITYWVDAKFDSSIHESRLLKDVHYYVYNDTSHDTLYVQYAFLLHWDFLKAQGCFPTHHIVWSDRCSRQFKSSRAWYFVSRYPSHTTLASLPNGCQMMWNFFATRHGKGEVDGAGALFKQEVRSEQIKPHGLKLQNIAEVVAFLKAEMNKFHEHHFR
jgi:hypothetical protein